MRFEEVLVQLAEQRACVLGRGVQDLVQSATGGHVRSRAGRGLTGNGNGVVGVDFGVLGDVALG